MTLKYIHVGEGGSRTLDALFKGRRHEGLEELAIAYCVIDERADAVSARHAAQLL